MVMEYMDHDFRSLMESMTRPFRTSEARPPPSPHTRTDKGSGRSADSGRRIKSVAGSRDGPEDPVREHAYRINAVRR